MLAKPVIKIPGKSIRPPDERLGTKCSNCGRHYLVPALKTDPFTKKTSRVCPYCRK
jgi:DNA-directed RNA polymerase subunit RPC12/RpoP